jgi:S-adenosylmethionine:tRNA ribosyltransferase-isomerase
VFNDARVLPAQFLLRKSTGGLVEGLFLGLESCRHWRVLLRNLGAADRALHFVEAPEIHASVKERRQEGEVILEIGTQQNGLELLARVGRMPLPPYIKRDRQHDQRDELDRERYQTVYARNPGAVAAPTAGLHFAPAILDELRAAGIEQAFVTLNVGLGTFKPVIAKTLEQHAMHAEAYSITSETASALNQAKREKRRIIAVGTTAARVLESQPTELPVAAKQAETSIFIFPPYRWKHLSGLITNFHLPRSTLIALVAAFVGLDEQRRIYQEAIEQRYRFFSYGDAMLIE